MEVRSIVVELDYHTRGISILIHKYGRLQEIIHILKDNFDFVKTTEKK